LLLPVLVPAAAGCSHGREAVSTLETGVHTSLESPRENGFYACQDMPSWVRGRAGRAPDTPRKFAARLRYYVHKQLHELAYHPSFLGCLDAAWTPRLGPRPTP
jgi:hypothetical protein